MWEKLRIRQKKKKSVWKRLFQSQSLYWSIKLNVLDANIPVSLSFQPPSFTWADLPSVKINVFAIMASIGAHRRTGSTQVQRTFRLRQLFKHEGFSMRNLRNDVALLQLAGSISPSPKVNTVCLPASGSRIPAGSRCYITGN